MDNFYKNTPAKMSDGRFLTDYRSSNVRELNNMYVNNVTNSNNYRRLLQLNGEKFIDNEFCNYKKVYTETNNDKCIHNYSTVVRSGDHYDELHKHNKIALNKIK